MKAIKCLVCLELAQGIAEPDFDGKIVKCKACGTYEISGTVLSKLEQSPSEERMDAFHKAKRFAKPGKRPAINRFCV